MKQEKPQKPLKAKISITVDIPILERLQREAEYEDRSLSSYINLVLRAHFAALDREREK